MPTTVTPRDELLFQAALTYPELWEHLKEENIFYNTKLTAVAGEIYKAWRETGEIPALSIYHEALDEYKNITIPCPLGKATKKIIFKHLRLLLEQSINRKVYFAQTEGKHLNLEEITKLYRKIPDFENKIEREYELSSRNDLVALIEEWKSRDQRHLPTGYSGIDGLIDSGGWKPSSTFLLMGLTGVG